MFLFCMKQSDLLTRDTPDLNNSKFCMLDTTFGVQISPQLN